MLAASAQHVRELGPIRRGRRCPTAAIAAENNAGQARRTSHAPPDVSRASVDARDASEPPASRASGEHPSGV
eukprot:6951591-Alexandrium_andersonii.AAC.1